MKNHIGLTLLSILFCCAGYAQGGPETADSSTGVHVRGLGSLPVVNFTATVKETERIVSLRWDADSAEDGDYFVVQRSQADLHYETIGVLRSTGTTGHYDLTDQAPPNGADYYRIKYVAAAGAPIYSKAVQLNLSGDVDFKFYPNPVDKLFIVRTEHTIDLEVLDPGGNVRVSKRLQPGIQVVNVSTLERGVYVLRVTDKESNRAISQQLVKN